MQRAENENLDLMGAVRVVTRIVRLCSFTTYKKAVSGIRSSLLGISLSASRDLDRCGYDMADGGLKVTDSGLVSYASHVSDTMIPGQSF